MVHVLEAFILDCFVEFLLTASGNFCSSFFWKQCSLHALRSLGDANGDYQEHLKEQTSSKGVLVWLDVMGLNPLLVAKLH